jgi:hypothetical protein
MLKKSVENGARAIYIVERFTSDTHLLHLQQFTFIDPFCF